MTRQPINIIIRQEVDADSRSELWQESNDEALDPEYDETATFLGYVSFSSMRHTMSLNSSYNKISFSLDSGNSLYDKTYVGAELIPKEQKGDQVQTSRSEFWDDEGKYRDIFRIQNDSVKILWQPDNDTTQSGKVSFTFMKTKVLKTTFPPVSPSLVSHFPLDFRYH